MFRVIVAAFIFSAVAAHNKIIVEDEPDVSCVKRPCSLQDIPCIRREFTKRGLCSKVKKYPFRKGELFVNGLTTRHPYFHCTATQDVCFKGLDTGKVTEFYINEKTGLTVFSVKFENVIADGNVVVDFHRSHKEDLVVRHNTYEEYLSVITTTIIPPGKCFKDNIRTTAQVDEKPYLYVGNHCEISNPTIRDFYFGVFDKRDIATATAFDQRAPIFQQYFVDNIICC